MYTPNFEDTGSGAQTPQPGVGSVGGGAKASAVPEPNPHEPQYRMGIGQRILGMANNFLQGMAHRGPVSYTGRGATNGRYAEDMETYRNSMKPLVRNDQAAKPAEQPKDNASWQTEGHWKPFSGNKQEPASP